MSHAEYAPKRLPVLTRLVRALRQIPAVDSAFARLGALLRGRRNAEPVIASEPATAASEAKSDTVETGATGSETSGTAAETDPGAAAGEAETVEADAIGTGASELEVTENETVEIDIVMADPVGIDTVEADGELTDSAEIETVETGAIAADTAEAVTEPDTLSEQEELATEVEAFAVEPATIDAVEAVVETTDSAEIESIEAGIIAEVTTESDALSEQEELTAEVESPAADPVGIDRVVADLESTDNGESEIVELGAIAADTAEAVTESDTLSEQEELSAEVEALAGEPATIDAAEVHVETTDSAEIETVEAGTIAAEVATESDVLPEQDEFTADIEAPAIDPVAVDPVVADAEAADTAEIEIVETGAGEPQFVEAHAAESDPVETATVTAEEVAPPVTKPDDLCEREMLVRRRWNETGIRMWNPRLHGAGHSALRIQGRVALLPPEPGETMPRYDTLEFRLIEGLIVCEGFKIDPPERAQQRPFAVARP